MLSQRLRPYKLALAAILAVAHLVCSAGPRLLALPQFELVDDLREAASDESRRADDRRVALASAELARELQDRGLYRISGAPQPEVVARCWVQKVSNLILNLNIEVRSAATGETLYVRSVDIRGNTDESWLRGVRRLVDNIEARGDHLR